MASSDSATGSSPSPQKQNGDDKFLVKALAITAAQLLANVSGIAQDTKKIGIPMRAKIPSFLTKADFGGMNSDDQDMSLVAEMKRADEILYNYNELKNSVEESGELDDELD
ncbi:hypothetical protein OIDMADRAFT_30614 [Oidiodendron maius Zn]|uniref:Uncharacterized protein n=1 Tax=Oidiodendron maius (strain Zn) TaxID=913774 RepID=A0A0C3GSC6_OIDMZ|nr:hypothetical protein OIDMADRAFT_30614 [Oidiodendron maius Zn]